MSRGRRPPRLARVAALAAILSGCAGSGALPGPAAPAHPGAATVSPACPDLDRWDARRLYGAWEVELPGLGQRGRLLLRQHPEFSASLRGEFDYGGHTSIASGDVEAGELNLDESRDGKTLYAFWTGQLVPAACGREIRGTWQQLPRGSQPARESPFVLRRVAGDRGW